MAKHFTHLRRGFSYLFFLVGISAASGYVNAAQKLHIYIDADRTGARASGLSIEQGIRTALSEVDNQLGGHEVELIIRDHRGSSPRSKKHLQEFLSDPQAFVLFSGLHSPPLLAHRDFINRQRIPVLDPWAAAAPITRPVNTENWIFRLSIDDSKAGFVITENAIKTDGFEKPFLLLEETGWGKSNHKTMTKALAEMGLRPHGVAWFNWNVGSNEARITLRQIAASGADVIFMVANAAEGKRFAKAMAELPKPLRLPIRSHWGITGGDFSEVINADLRKHLDLKFIQTRFSFLNKDLSETAKSVLAKAKALFPQQIKSPMDIQAPVGFIHAYDLTKILIAATAQLKLSDDVLSNRLAVHHALENLQHPIEGLIKVYRKPFSNYTSQDPNAHEALNENDYVMARYGERNEIILE